MLRCQLALELIEVKYGHKLIGEVREIKDAFFIMAEHGLAAVELLPVTKFDFVGSSHSIGHYSYLTINCELIDNNFAIWEVNLQFSHVVSYFPQEVAADGPVFVKDEFEDDFALLVEPHLKDDQSFRVEEGHEVVFYDGEDGCDEGEAEFLESNIPSSFDHLSRIDKSIIMAKDDISLGCFANCSGQNIAHLRRKAISLIIYLGVNHNLTLIIDWNYYTSLFLPILI